VTAPSWLNLD